MTVEQFEQTVAVRYFGGFGCNDYKYKNLKSLDEAIHLRWEGVSDDEMASLRDNLTVQLKSGAFHYVAVAQRFTSTVLRTVDYMNAAMPKSRFYAVEMVRFAADGFGAFESRTIQQPTSVTGRGAAGAGGSAVKTIDEQHFLDSISDPTYREVLAEFIEFLKGFGLTLYWGTVGFSVRADSGDGGPLLSIGWIFPPGRSGWMGLTDLNFGFDPASAKSHPTLLRALDGYVAELAAITGAVPVVKGNLKSFHFAPDAAAWSILQVKEIIGQVVTAISRGGVEEPDTAARV